MSGKDRVISQNTEKLSPPRLAETRSAFTRPEIYLLVFGSDSETIVQALLARVLTTNMGTSAVKSGLCIKGGSFEPSSTPFVV